MNLFILNRLLVISFLFAGMFFSLHAQNASLTSDTTPFAEKRNLSTNESATPKVLLPHDLSYETPAKGIGYKLLAYPNPAKQGESVFLASNEAMEVHISDMSGKSVLSLYKLSDTELEIATQHLPKGVYNMEAIGATWVKKYTLTIQ